MVPNQRRLDPQGKTAQVMAACSGARLADMSNMNQGSALAGPCALSRLSGWAVSAGKPPTADSLAAAGARPGHGDGISLPAATREGGASHANIGCAPPAKAVCEGGGQGGSGFDFMRVFGAAACGGPVASAPPPPSGPCRMLSLSGHLRAVTEESN